MLTLPPSVRIYLAAEPVDMRRGHDGLAAIVRNQWKLDLSEATYLPSLDAKATAARSCSSTVAVLFCTTSGWNVADFAYRMSRPGRHRWRWMRPSWPCCSMGLTSGE